MIRSKPKQGILGWNYLLSHFSNYTSSRQMLEELIGCWLKCNSLNLVTFISEEISVYPSCGSSLFLLSLHSMRFFRGRAPYHFWSRVFFKIRRPKASSFTHEGSLFEVKEKCHGRLSARASLRLFISSGPSATGERLIFVHR